MHFLYDALIIRALTHSHVKIKTKSLMTIMYKIGTILNRKIIITT